MGLTVQRIKLISLKFDSQADVAVTRFTCALMVTAADGIPYRQNAHRQSVSNGYLEHVAITRIGHFTQSTLLFLFLVGF